MTDHDETLRQRIIVALIEDGHVGARAIEVTVQDAVAELHGTVQSYRRKLAAQEAASSVEDVDAVVNQLEVQPAPDELDDVDIATAVREALDSSDAITKEAVGVEVLSGDVTLSGSVGSDKERYLAEDLAVACPGVRTVKNHLIVDVLETVEDRDLSERIRNVLAETLELRDIPIDVTASHEAVILSGEVFDLWQKDLAETVVRQAGVVHVRNDIVVRPVKAAFSAE